MELGIPVSRLRTSLTVAVRALLVLTWVCVLVCRVCEAYPFTDVSLQAGLSYARGKQKKYGGACVADLDGDGWPDLLFLHHNDASTELYFNQRDGTFQKAPWGVHVDAHSFVPFHPSTSSRSMSFFLARGGGNGSKHKTPLIYNISPQRKITESAVPAFTAGRGRSAVLMSLRPGLPGRTSTVIFIHQEPLNKRPPFHRVADIVPEPRRSSSLGVRLVRQGLSGSFMKEENSFGTPVDIDGDGLMELASFQDFKVYKVQYYFGLVDITYRVIPRYLDVRGVVAVAELDYNNDGMMDLYLARSSTVDLKWLRRSIGAEPSDILLRNVGRGRYVDASREARIPQGGGSRSVTTGDFNNDGFIDILVIQLDQPHRLLLNNGDGTFRNVMPNFGRYDDRPGDGAVAVDYDRDGRLDVVVSNGHYFNSWQGGYYRIIRNVGAVGNFLHVRVGHSWNRRTTSLHALVTAYVNRRKQKMIRRVGSPGTTISLSYIELIHFGLGPYKYADVLVRWADGSTQFKQNVRANSFTLFGVV